MQKYNLLSAVRRKKFHYCSQYLHRYPNILNRELNAERPNQKWVTDISYIKTAQGFLYLSIIRDLYDNSIVAYKMDKEQSIKLVRDTIKAAKRKEKITAELQTESVVEEESTTNNTNENATLLAKLLSNPKTAALLKALAKTLEILADFRRDLMRGRCVRICTCDF